MDLEIIAEIGQAHDGSLGILHSYIDAIASTGVDTIKFQTHIAEAESSSFEPFRIKFSYEDKLRFDYWKRMQFTKSQWIGIKDHCEKCGVQFLSSPFSCAAVKLLNSIGAYRYKIGSGETTNLLLLENIAKTGKPVILSSGMSDYNELDLATSYLNERGTKYSILQCTTKYPTAPKNIGLNILKELRNRYKVDIGFSDHSGNIFPSLAAVALGAKIIEVHVVFDKKMFGPDSSSSITIEQLKNLVEGARYIKEIMNNPISKDNNADFKELKMIFEKSLSVNKSIKKGDILTIDILESKKPKGHGIDANDFQNIIGKRVKNNMKKWQFLTKDDIE